MKINKSKPILSIRSMIGANLKANSNPIQTQFRKEETL